MVQSTRTGSEATWRIVLLLLVGLSPLTSALGQAEFRGAPDDFGVNVRVYPSDIYSPRVGPGIGLGLVAHNLARANDRWLVTAAPALHEQVGTLSFASANPQTAQRYVLADIRALHTDRDWVFGRGAHRFVLERTSWHGRTRFGHAFLNDHLLLQPQILFSTHRIDDLHPQSTGPDSVHAGVPTRGSRQTGLRPGIGLEVDTRNSVHRSTRGILLQGTWRYYHSLNGTQLRYHQFEGNVYANVPLGGVHRLALRVSSLVTQPQGNDSIPVYMRPRLGASHVPGLGRNQFVGLDRLIGSALYRFPVTNFYGLAAIEGHIGIHLAGIYDDLGSQFERTVSFDAPANPQEKKRSLRPAASTGVRFFIPSRERASIELAVGISPYGLSAVHFTFSQSLQAIRPPHHDLSHLW